MENKVESTESVFKFSGYLNTDIDLFIQKLQFFSLKFRFFILTKIFYRINSMTSFGNERFTKGKYDLSPTNDYSLPSA